MARKKRTGKPGPVGPRAQFDHDLLLAKATSGGTNRHKSLVKRLQHAGFTDAPEAVTFRMWETRHKIADAWLPTVLYAALVSGERITMRQLLKVQE